MASKRTTKADVILASARESLRIAETDVEQALAVLKQTEAVLTAYKRIYADLERTLAATPRKASAPKSPAPSVGRRLPLNIRASRSAVSTEGDKGSASDASNKGVVLPDNPEEFQHGATA